MRIYLPSTLTHLASAVKAHEFRAVSGTGFGVTTALTEAYPDSDLEELEYLAMLDAARASLRLLAAEVDADEASADGASADGASAAKTFLRVVVAADVSEVTERDDLDRAVVRISGPVPWAAVAAVHIDGADAGEAVSAAIKIIDAADLGDLDAEFVLGSAEDYELAWYAPEEISYLLSELGLDS